MEQDIHSTFKNVCADQEFAVDDIIAELERKRDLYMKLLDEHLTKTASRVEKLKNAVKSNETISTTAYFAFDRASSSSRDLTECQNALIVMNKLKEKGETTITLNPGKNMRHQILARADHAGFGSRFSGYKYKLKNDR